MRARAKVAARASEPGSRRALIADAVISLLAREGGRGVTHGKIDRLLGLPQGSTSFYFRRRAELFEAGLRELVAKDLMDLTEAMGSLFSKRSDTLTARTVARRQYALWRRNTCASMRHRAIARFEFFLLAARDARFAQLHAEARRAIFDFGAEMFRRMGARNPRSAAVEYGYLVRGDLIAYWFLPPSLGRHRVTPSYYEQHLQEIIVSTDRLPADTRTLPIRERVLA